MPTFRKGNNSIYVTWYKPSEWLYLLTGKCPEWDWLYNVLDHIRWGMERLGI
jgi:hypothetical protein